MSRSSNEKRREQSRRYRARRKKPQLDSPAQEAQEAQEVQITSLKQLPIEMQRRFVQQVTKLLYQGLIDRAKKNIQWPTELEPYRKVISSEEHAHKG